MDDKVREDFLASVEAEEDWLDQVSRRLSLPSASATPRDPPTIVNPPTLRKPPASTGPTTRSTRKRPPTEMSEGQAPSKKSSRDDKALIDRLEQMIGSVRSDIAKSESNTASLIDSKLETMSTRLSGRMDGAEASISTLSADVTTLRRDLSDVKRKSDVQARSLTAVVEDIVSRKLNNAPAFPLPRPLTGPAPQVRKQFDSKYWEARRSLRLWPVPGPDRVACLLDFLHNNLKMPVGKIRADQFVIQVVDSPQGNNDVSDPIVVTFDSIRLRDEVKSLARNLAGTDRSIGVQMEAPDHLRSHYQAFQKLGFHIKRKHAALRRNVKFDDFSMSLVMDVKLDESASWKTIDYAAAKDLLKRVKTVPTVDKKELENMVDLAAPTSAKKNSNDFSDSDDDYADAVVIPDENNNADNRSRRFVSFINTNARSLLPKMDSLCDCLIEKDCDFALVSETWLQTNRLTEEALAEYMQKYSIGLIGRNRTTCAVNNRQYGGVAVVYRKKSTTLREFPLTNPLAHEVVAAVGKINGIRGKVFIVAAYAPPNLTPQSADQLIEFLSDVVSEGKRKFPDCTVIIGGDFNQWPVENLQNATRSPRIK